VTDAEPGVRHALIGGAFGLLLIYLGALIPFRILSWPIVGMGALFVVVMTSYTLVVLWKPMSGYARPLFSRVRGHVRNDPQLGTLTCDTNAHCWLATLTRGDRTVNVVIQGDDEPNPPLLAHARDLLARFDTLERRVEEYLAHEAEKETSSDPEMASEIRALNISSVNLRSPDRAGHVVIDFEGPDEMRYWYCHYVNGELSQLSFDT
jgi:hypothetical protein